MSRTLCLAMVLAACGGRSATVRPHEVANTANAADRDDHMQLVSSGVGLVDEDRAPVATLSAAEASRSRAQLRDAGTGDRAWLFRGFSATELRFVECHHLPPPDPRPIKRTARCAVDRTIRVPRTDDAAAALGVADEIRQYEEGVCGIRIGTPLGEVRARFGEPTAVAYPAAAGCVQHRYGELAVYLCFDEVKGVTLDAGECPR